MKYDLIIPLLTSYIALSSTKMSYSQSIENVRPQFQNLDEWQQCDTLGPEVQIELPARDFWKNRTIDARGVFKDEAGVEKIVIQNHLGEFKEISLVINSEVEITIPLTLIPGINSWTFQVYDKLGNKSITNKSLYFGSKTAAGGSHSLTINSQDPSKLLVWGRNNLGQLGLPSGDPALTPTELSFNQPIVSVSASLSHTVALDKDGATWTWGRNRENQLGRPGPSDQAMRVDGLPQIVSIATGQRHTLALDSEGFIWAWGSNRFGQLGINSIEPTSSVPIKITSLPEIVSIAAGGSFSLAITKEGDVFSWGDNRFGQLAQPTETTYTPLKVIGIPQIISVAAGRGHSLAIASNGDAYSWGLNASGQLGLGDLNDRNQPILIESLPRIASIEASGNFSFGLSRSGEVFSWGQNFNGQLGTGSAGLEADTDEPNLISISEISDISTGLAHSIAINKEGEIFTWGLNSFGQLGNGLFGFETGTTLPDIVLIP